MEVLENGLQNWDYILLVVLRVSGIIWPSPLFGRKNIPNIVKIGFCACVAIVFFMSKPEMAPLDYNDDVIIFVMLCVVELLFGMVLGFVLNLFFQLVFTSGYLIDMQIGFAMVSMFDADANSTVPIMGNFLNIILLMLFYLSNGHLKIIDIVNITLYRIPVGTAELSPAIASVALELFANAFLMSIQIAMPIVAAAIVTEAVLGTAIRAVPQVNAFVVGMPLKVIVGLVVMVSVVPAFSNGASSIFDSMYIGLDQMFSALMG